MPALPHGLPHTDAVGRPVPVHDLAEALATGTVILDLPYRGHRVQAVTTRFGAFARRDVFGCFAKISPDTLGEWRSFTTEEAATAWCCNSLAGSLYRTSPAGVDRQFAVWHGSRWSVEIDAHRQRYTLATGTSPNATYDVLDAREDPDERLAAVEARGWAWILERMPIPVPHWPRTMADEYLRRVLLADVK
ncbi:hypothetical protein ACIQF6_28440 [Kitasatospora sp. NPDC092948]|uniref:hypothetical protein n=1 Tax=Kitasatospora sp. NPDC092948 TaxID=3364088 RepID=UPI00380BA58A